MFLKDVLVSRLTVEGNRLHWDAGGESSSMLLEMGLPDDFKSQQLKSMTFDKTVGAVLQGRLKVTHQLDKQNPTDQESVPTKKTQHKGHDENHQHKENRSPFGLQF